MTRARSASQRLVLLASIVFAPPLHAQTIDDGIMVARHNIFVADVYTHDSWNEYWEGALRRTNGNIGTITTQTNNWFGNYGVSDRLNVMATVPQVWTRASQGVLHGQSGFQDITIAAKYRLLERASTSVGAWRVFAVVATGLPLTDYTPDFYPLSIGSASTRVSGRATVNVRSTPGWYVNVSTAYAWRADVSLDRPYYYTNGQLFFTNQVDMPNVFDSVASAGYMNGGLMTEFSYAQQRTLGGGDIRRQDMPFVSNRMNFSRVGGMVKSPLPKLRSLAAQVAYVYTLNGRNVGQSTTVTTALMYTLPFHRMPLR
jgi:hypothetical protein